LLPLSEIEKPEMSTAEQAAGLIIHAEKSLDREIMLIPGEKARFTLKNANL